MTAAAHLALAEGRLGLARSTLARAVVVGVKSADMPVLSSVAVASADLAWHEHRSVDAAELLGAADVVRGAADPTHVDTVRLTTALVGELGAADFAAAHDRGRSTPRDVAIDRLRA